MISFKQIELSNMIIDWSEIDTVMLDMDGTILDLHFDNFFWLHYLPNHYALQFPGDESAAKDKLFQRMKSLQGTLNWYCTDFWAQELDIEIMSLKQQISDLINERPRALTFLRALGAKGKLRMLVTNAHRDSLNLKLSKTSIEPQLDKIVSSHDYGHPKEAQQFWLSLDKDIHFNANRTLFIDDSISVLQAARKFGIEHLLCIDAPDSMAKPAPCADFPSISHFDELLSPDGSLVNG